MAHLIDSSGRRDIVARVAASRNTAHVAELAGDAALVDWLDEHGLTAAEAAQIQPEYEPGPGGTGALALVVMAMAWTTRRRRGRFTGRRPGPAR